MTAVLPTPCGVHVAERPVRRSIRILRAVGKWVRCVAGRLPGEYTIAKLDTFDRFRRESTPSWLVMILLLTPVPCILTSLVLESIPLSDPATGFLGSLHFQIRNYLTAMIMTAMPVFMKLDCVPQLSWSWKLVLGYSMTTAAVAIANNAIIAVATRVFPVPFTQFAPAVPMAAVGLLLNHLFPQPADIKQRVQKIEVWIAMDMMPVIVYPIFTAFFMALEPSQQLWLSLLLPVIKRLLRHAIWLMLQDDLDLVGPTTSSVGHLYHVLFTATCLQNAKSLETLVAVVAVNILQMLLNCRDIFNDASNLRGATDQAHRDSEDVVSKTLKVAQQAHISRSLHKKTPSRIFSNYPGYQGAEFVARHHKYLEEKEPRCTSPVVVAYGGQNPRRGSTQQSLLSAESLSKQTTPAIEHRLTQILPFSDGTLHPHASLQCDSPNAKTMGARPVHSIEPRTDQARQDEVYVRSVTSALHQTESILLRSYITLFILSFYGLYLILVFWLPNRAYFATMATTTTFAAVDSKLVLLLVVGSMELVFLVTYFMLISYKLGISGIHQLAFILWSQRVLLQSKFVALSIMILGFPLEHYGNGAIYKLRTGCRQFPDLQEVGSSNYKWPLSPTPAARRPVRSGVQILRAVSRFIRRAAGRLPGEYTIGKLDVYQQFREGKTSFRVLTVLLTAPIPCVLMNLLVECIPLADPATSLRGSLHFQARHFLSGIFASVMPVFVKFVCVPVLSVRSWKFVFVYGVTLASVAIGSKQYAGVFPVSFAQFSPTVPLAIVGGTLKYLFLQTPNVKQRVEKIEQWIAIAAVPIFVYPIFTAVFMTFKPQQQLWLSLLLPVIKRLLHQIIWLVLKDDLDLVGATACTVSHLYHVHFTALCLQNTKSLKTLTAIELVNIVQMLLSCRDIMKDADDLERSRSQFTDTPIVVTADAVSAALKLADDADVSRCLHQQLPSRLVSKFPGYQPVGLLARANDAVVLPNACQIVAPQIDLPQNNPRRGSRYRNLLSAASLSKKFTPPIAMGLVQILPVSDGLTHAPPGTRQDAFQTSQAADAPQAQTLPSIQLRRDHTRVREIFIHSVTSALHQTEMILLRSYITIFVLSFYGKCTKLVANVSRSTSLVLLSCQSCSSP